MTAQQHPNHTLAQQWVDAFNAHDVDAVVSLYAEACTHSSPRIRALHPETGGQLVGKAALHRWWTHAIERLPGVRYTLYTVTADEHRAVIEYLRVVLGEPDQLVAEVFDIAGGRITASRVYPG